MVEFVDYEPNRGHSWFAIATPATPLRPSTAYSVTLAGATDLAGNLIPTVSSSFTTSAGPDLDPYLVSWSPLSSGAPRNSAISLEFDEPVNPVTLHPNALFAYVTAPSDFFSEIFSADGRTVTLLPNELFPENTNVSLSVGAVRDIAGNGFSGYVSPLNFSFGTEIDATTPQLRIALPANGALDVPINSKIVIQLDSEIRPGSLDPAKIQVQTGGAAIPIRMEITDLGRALELSPTGLFNPLTTYTWSVDGLLDLAGNALPAALQGSFTTGSGALTTAPAIVSSTPAAGATGIALDATWVVAFDSPINPADLSVSLYPSGAEPAAWTLSPDGKTLTVTRAEPWPPGSSVSLSLDYTGLNGVRRSSSLNAMTAP